MLSALPVDLIETRVLSRIQRHLIATGFFGELYKLLLQLEPHQIDAQSLIEHIEHRVELPCDEIKRSLKLLYTLNREYSFAF